MDSAGGIVFGGLIVCAEEEVSEQLFFGPICIESMAELFKFCPDGKMKLA